MTQNNIYGIGGALVDTEVLVSDKFLAENQIEKGVMSLVDRDRQTELMFALESEGVKLVKKCGGSVCNSVVAAANLGAKAFFSGKVANDSDGKLFISDLNKAGVKFHSLDLEPGTTGRCLVFVTPDAERTMNTFLGVSDELSEKEIDIGTLKNSDFLFIEAYLLTDYHRRVTVKNVVNYCKRNGIKVAMSLSDPSVADLYGEAIRETIGTGIDLIFCNKAEAEALTKASNLKLAIEKLKSCAKTFAITDGSNGSITFDGKSILKSKGVKVNAVDTNGAGDMFAGVFLYAITSGKSYECAAELANICAAKVVSKFGPRLESSELYALKEIYESGTVGTVE